MLRDVKDRPRRDAPSTSGALLAAMVALASVFYTASALAYDRILLRPGDVGADASFLQRLLDQDKEDLAPRPYDDRDEEDMKWSEEYVRKWINFDHVYVGRFDLNDDGKHELFVMLGWGCGTAGCRTYLYGQTAAGWKEIPVFIDPRPVARRNAYQLFASEERIGGYRTLVGSEFGGRWQPAAEFTDMSLMDEAKYRGLPGQYLLMCFSEQCAHETDLPKVKKPRR
jgi:hypothetical protein